MPKLRMIADVTGTRDTGDGPVDWPARGETIEVTADEAASLIHSGIAVAAKDAPVESAAVENKPLTRSSGPAR